MYAAIKLFLKDPVFPDHFGPSKQADPDELPCLPHF